MSRMATILLAVHLGTCPAGFVMQVNDLDLTVRAAGLAGYTLYGNGQPDHLNNVEQARPPLFSADAEALGCIV